MQEPYEKAPERMLRARATSTLVFRQRVVGALEEAGIPEAESGWDDSEDVPTCTRSGYHVLDQGTERGKVVDVVILGRTGVPDAVRQGERDALMQQVRTVLAEAGISATVNEYGHLKAVNR